METPLHQIAESCARNTDLMIQQCTDANTILSQQKPGAITVKATKRNSEHLEVQSTNKKAKKKHGDKSGKNTDTTQPTKTNGTFAPPIEDPSGLFSIDSNPTPIEELLKPNGTDNEVGKSKKKGRDKRRRSSQDIQAPTQPSPVQSDESSVKRKKTKHDKDDNQSIPGKEDEEHAEAFEQKVALRIKEKDEEKKKKANKKRKRESDSSAANVEEKVEPVNADLALHLLPPLKPGKRRRLELKAMKEVIEKERAAAARNVAKGEEKAQKDDEKTQKDEKKSRKKRNKSQ